jgi:polyhydroxyalkanoate synthesis repressor PhaR
MARLIKRYGSRKLYDTVESRYVGLDQIADWVKAGEDIQVIDNATTENVTAQTLTQVISDLGRKKENFLSTDVLHDLIRWSETAAKTGVKRFQQGVDVLVEKSFGRLNPVKDIKEEMNLLKKRLMELEESLDDLDAKSRPKS